MTTLYEDVERLIIENERQIKSIKENLPQRDVEKNDDYEAFLARMKFGLNETKKILDSFDTLK